MKIHCSCGALVVEGDIRENKKHRQVLDLMSSPQGTIIKNNSNNPRNWTGVCANCQKKKEGCVVNASVP